MLSDDILRFVFVYDARFADALTWIYQNFGVTPPSGQKLCLKIMIFWAFSGDKVRARFSSRSDVVDNLCSLCCVVYAAKMLVPDTIFQK